MNLAVANGKGTVSLFMVWWVMLFSEMRHRMTFTGYAYSPTQVTGRGLGYVTYRPYCGSKG